MPERIGDLLAYVAVALSAINAPYSLFLADDGPLTPFPFDLTYLAAALALFVGLAFLGLGAWRSKALPPRWRLLPLAIGLSALLPVWALALVHLKLPIVALGLAWMLLGYVLWSRRDEPVRRPTPVS